MRTPDISPLTLDIRPMAYDHRDARRLVDEVQQEYVIRYGGPDETPLDHAHFSPPLGLFVILYDETEPVAMGGWRIVESGPRDLGPDDGPSSASPSPQPVVAELKRMYVVPSRRGRGLARAVLAHLEVTAAAAGAGWLVLETGTMQPEAIALYAASGYTPVPPFGHYADQPGSIHLGKGLPAPADPSAAATGAG
ncbi:MAG: GNAT family N-acetyltransferase [Nakamurella sp.]